MKLPARRLMGRTIIADPPTPKEQVHRLRAQLARAAIDAELRNDVDSILRRIEGSKAAVDALWPPAVGRKRADNHNDIALHYLVLKELMGRGKSIRARQRVAREWGGLEAKTVADIFSSLKVNAEYWLNYWLESAFRENGFAERSGITIEGTFHAYPDWTREAVLKVLDFELTEKARRRTNSGK
jgi:hypothetical protein